MRLKTAPPSQERSVLEILAPPAEISRKDPAPPTLAHEPGPLSTSISVPRTMPISLSPSESALAPLSSLEATAVPAVDVRRAPIAKRAAAADVVPAAARAPGAAAEVVPAAVRAPGAAAEVVPAAATPKPALAPPVPNAVPSLKALLPSLPANICVLDTEGVIVAVNESWPAFTDVSGFPRTSHGVGINYLATCDQLGHADSRRAAAGIRSVLAAETEQFSMEYILEVPSGDAWYLLIATPVGVGHPTGVTLVHLDITAKKRVESNVWRFATAMDSLTDGVLLIDRASMAITYVNDAACEMFGVSHDQLMARLPWEGAFSSRAELEQKYDRLVIMRVGAAEAEETLLAAGRWISPFGSRSAATRTASTAP